MDPPAPVQTPWVIRRKSRLIFKPFQLKPLVAQWVKNLPKMQETQVRSLNREDPLEKKMVTHCSILASMDGGAWWATVHGVAKSRTRLSDFILLEKAFLSLLGILWNSAFRWVPLSLSPLPFASLFSPKLHTYVTGTS